MPIIQILFFAIIQGLAELLPVSSSAHVIVAQRLMGIDPSTPSMTLLLVMLHTGTMFAVLFYFWGRWKRILASPERMQFLKMLGLATLATAVLGYGLKHALEHWILTPEPGQAKAEIESLFKNLYGVSAAVFAAGLLITIAGLSSVRRHPKVPPKTLPKKMTEHFSSKNSLIIGAVQGICIPFRGFSRSGATISTSLLRGIPQVIAEDFSFALVVILTPAAILHLVKRLLEAQVASGGQLPLNEYFIDGALGMGFSFVAGMIGLKWLSSWLENGKWQYFGYYCVAFSGLTFWLAYLGY